MKSACNHHCDPHAPGARSDGASHFLDCPVWVYLGVVKPCTTPDPNDEPGARAEGESL